MDGMSEIDSLGFHSRTWAKVRSSIGLGYYHQASMVPPYTTFR